jgi:hypothetical protein
LLLAAICGFFSRANALASVNPTVNGPEPSIQKFKPLHEAELQRLFPEGKHPQLSPLAEIAGQLSEKWTAAKKVLTSYKTLTKVLPIVEWLPQYVQSQWTKSLYKDVSAGVVVGIMLVPQAIAYAMVASLPPQYG